MADRADGRQQFVDAFEGTDDPVTSPMAHVTALPQGPGTHPRKPSPG